MNIKSTKYVKSSIFNPNNKNTSITLTLSDDTTLSVPVCVGNTEYDAILVWAAIDGNSIEDAD